MKEVEESATDSRYKVGSYRSTVVESYEESVRIRRLEIHHFRGIKHAVVNYDSLAVLVGANNSGKTTIVEAMALVLGRDRLVRNLTEHDFYGSKPKPGDRIHIIATIADFRQDDPDQNADWFRSGRGIEKWLPKAGGDVSSTKQHQDDQLVCQIAVSARFDSKNLEVETIRYFFDDILVDPFDEGATVVQVPYGLIRDLGFFLVSANRTWDRTISFESELFRRVVKYVGGQPSDAVIAERDRLRSPKHPIEDDPKLRELVDEVDADISSLFGRTTKLKLRLTSTDSPGVLEAVVPHFDTGNTNVLPSRRHGAGLVSLQTLVLLVRFGHLRVQDGESFLMAIEEPELHVPPHLQRKLLHLMQSLATQVVVTTHSPTVATMPSPHELIVVRNENGVVRADPLLDRPMDTSSTNLMRSMFLSDRDDTVGAIMHQTVLVPEGKHDASWLRLLARASDLNANCISPSKDTVHFGHEVGIVPTKDSRIIETFRILSQVHSSVCCLVDGDPQGTTYANNIAKLASAPRTIVQWPDGWEMEDIVGWILEAEPAILASAELAQAGLPDKVPNLVYALKTKQKSDALVHSLLADAITTSSRCIARTRQVLNVIADACAGRHAAATDATKMGHSNGVTTLWTFCHDVPGI
jgi:putative ATP-dependent endonuclease of OLD family